MSRGQAGVPCQRSAALNPNEVRAEKRAEILRMLRAGQIMPVIARRTGVARATVYRIAKAAGIDYARGKGGPQGEATPAPVAATEPNYRARAASLRWNGGLGGSFW